MTFKDHFSRLSEGYSRFRPTYPPALFHWLASVAPDRSRAWDCATGTGQAACALAGHFQEVVATDASAEQIAQANQCRGVHYAVAPAEESRLADHSVALITVAQALHWFDLPRFYAEVRRVSLPGGVVAAWTYNLFSVSAEIDPLIERFYGEIVGPFWPPERKVVEQGYASLPFPFAPVTAPPFTMESCWSVEHALGYFGTWSAVQRYKEREGRDPVALIDDELRDLWGSGERPVTWPLALKVGRVG